MKRTAISLFLALLALSPAVFSQTTPSSGDLQVPQSGAARTPVAAHGKNAKHKAVAPIKPFSHIALGGGVSLMGGNMQAAINANRYLNLRGTGNYIDYTVNNINVSGFNVNGKLNMATGGASIDLYPFPNHGFRLSAGALFYNQNAVSANITASGGTSFTLNSVKYYSSVASPVQGSGSVGFNTQNPAPTFTTGWGNMIPRKGGHWSVPFEIGAAMTGVPAVNLALTSGQVCTNAAGTVGCMNVVGNTTLNTNLQAQIAKYQNDLNPLRFYPIISIGLAYSFPIR